MEIWVFKELNQIIQTIKVRIIPVFIKLQVMRFRLHPVL